MSEALKLKRHLFITSVENAEGTQTWWVDAASKEDALAKFEAGNCEIYSSEVEVTKLGEPEYLGATSLDDFGDAENKTEIESLRAERDAVMEKHFQAVEAQVKLIHERDALKQKLGPALEAALGELMYGTCPKAITIVKAAIDAAKEQQ